MKSKIIAGVGIVVLAIALIFAMKPKSFDKQFLGDDYDTLIKQ